MYHQQHANRKIKTKLEISKDKIMDTPIWKTLGEIF